MKGMPFNYTPPRCPRCSSESCPHVGVFSYQRSVFLVAAAAVGFSVRPTRGSQTEGAFRKPTCPLCPEHVSPPFLCVLCTTCYVCACVCVWSRPVPSLRGVFLCESPC